MYQHKVQYYETDMMGITHHSNYIRWMEEARTEFLDGIGWPYKRMEEEGIFSPVINVECAFKKTTSYEDVINIELIFEEFKGVKLKVRYVMTNEAGAIVCEGRSEHCFINKEGLPISVKKVNPELFALISECVTGQE